MNGFIIGGCLNPYGSKYNLNFEEVSLLVGYGLVGIVLTLLGNKTSKGYRCWHQHLLRGLPMHVKRDNLAFCDRHSLNLIKRSKESVVAWRI